MGWSARFAIRCIGIMGIFSSQIALGKEEAKSIPACTAVPIQYSSTTLKKLSETHIPEFFRQNDPDRSCEQQSFGRNSVPIRNLNSQLPQPARDAFDLAFLKPTEKAPVTSTCVSMALQGRDTGKRATKGGPTYFTCSGSKLQKLSAAPCQTDEDRKNIRKLFHMVTECLNLDPQMLYPLWTEESGFQYNIRNAAHGDFGFAQVTRISLKDSSQTLADPRQKKMILEKISARTDDPFCSNLIERGSNVAKAVLADMKKEEATGASKFHFNDDHYCSQVGSFVQGEDAVALNMLISSMTFAKSVYYFNASMKQIFKKNPALADLPFASNEEARKIFAVLARETGMGHTLASRLAKTALLHYHQKFQETEFKKLHPKGLTYEMFQKDFLAPKDSKFVVHKLIERASRTRTAAAPGTESEKRACFADFRPIENARNVAAD